ncbi:MAG: 6,7-dimethyl-8-ribityllumazine synthase [Ignavibacteriales bacterium]|nr:6,7-dimethyl-8-ribityllumazine synthase [Ignavibacteriales bacterium]
MANIIQGFLSAKEKKFAIVISRFNEFISNKLLTGALDCLNRHDCLEKDIDIVWTPGSFEIPLAAKKIAQKNNYDAVICLGAIIRGSTPHFDFVASEVSKGIATASLETGVPIIYGIITSDNIEQAIERAGTKSGNKGWDAALSAIEMADLFKKLE